MGSGIIRRQSAGDSDGNASSPNDVVGAILSGVVEQVGRSGVVGGTVGASVTSLGGGQVGADGVVVAWLVSSHALILLIFACGSGISKVASASIGSSAVTMDTFVVADGFTAVISLPSSGSTVADVGSNASSSVAFLGAQAKALWSFAIVAGVERVVGIASASGIVRSNTHSSMLASTDRSWKTTRVVVDAIIERILSLD